MVAAENLLGVYDFTHDDGTFDVHLRPGIYPSCVCLSCLHGALVRARTCTRVCGCPCACIHRSMYEPPVYIYVQGLCMYADNCSSRVHV